MSLDQMNQYSSTGTDQAAVLNREVLISAGDVGSNLIQVFSGTIFRSFIDFSGLPDVSFCVAACAGYYNKATASSANHYPGAQNAEDIIAALSAKAGFEFVNNGAHAVLQNQYCYGSIVDQIQSVAKAAIIPMAIENNKVYIWPNNGTRDDTIISISPDNGMIGYPAYWEAGFIVKCEFNPQIANGRTIALTSSIPKSNVTVPVQMVTHELSTLAPNGAWFTTSKLSPSNYVPVN